MALIVYCALVQIIQSLIVSDEDDQSYCRQISIADNEEDKYIAYCSADILKALVCLSTTHARMYCHFSIIILYTHVLYTHHVIKLDVICTYL